MKLWKLILILSLSLVAVKVEAAGLSVNPGSLSFTLKQGEADEQSFWVENISNKPALVSIYADTLNESFKFQPDTFRLDPKTRQKVFTSFSIKSKGLFTTNISIVGQDLDRREFNVATGLKLPVKINVLENNTIVVLWQQIIILTICGLMVLLGLLMIVRHHRKKTLLEKAEDKIDLLKHHRKGWFKKLFM